MSIYNKIYALLLSLPKKHIYHPILGIQFITMIAYIWTLFYAIDSNLFLVIFGGHCWKNKKRNHKNLKLPAWYVGTTAYKIYAVICLNRSLWHSFHLDPSAQCFAIGLGQIWFIVDILASQRDMEKSCFKTSNSAIRKIHPWRMLL